MKLSTVAVLLAVILCLGKLSGAHPSESPAPVRSCERLELLAPYLDLDHYRQLHPYVDYDAAVKPITDFLEGRGISNTGHDLVMLWGKVCRAKTPEEEILAWKNLATEVNHRLHTDESVFKIVQMMHGRDLAAYVFSPSRPMMKLATDNGHHKCGIRWSRVFAKHCGPLGIHGLGHVSAFTVMCANGVKEYQFANAASQTCKGYTYVPV